LPRIGRETGRAAKAEIWGKMPLRKEGTPGVVCPWPRAKAIDARMNRGRPQTDSVLKDGIFLS
jgi:hypothetical protein